MAANVNITIFWDALV